MSGAESEFRGAAGVQIVGAIFSRARQEFWPTAPPERGVDAIVGVCIEARRTGAFVAVQVKCGASYFRADGTPTLKATQSHFAYWRQARLPVVGIVVDEGSGEASWVYLNDPGAFGQRSAGTSVAPSVAAAQRLDASNALQMLRAVLSEYEGGRRALEPVDSADYRGVDVDGGEPRLDERQTWTLLLERFTSESIPVASRINAGHRLSWYFPTVGEEQRDETFARMSSLTDVALAAILDCIGSLIESDSPDSATLVAEMLNYTPHAASRIATLHERVVLTRRALEWREQSCDVLEDVAPSDTTVA